jgi:hypothetical protein
MIFRLNIKRGFAPFTNQHRFAPGDWENRNEEKREKLPEAVFPQVRKEVASVASLPQAQSVFHGRFDCLGAE